MLIKQSTAVLFLSLLATSTTTCNGRYFSEIQQQPQQPKPQPIIDAVHFPDIDEDASAPTVIASNNNNNYASSGVRYVFAPQHVTTPSSHDHNNNRSSAVVVVTSPTARDQQRVSAVQTDAYYFAPPKPVAPNGNTHHHHADDILPQSSQTALLSTTASSSAAAATSTQQQAPQNRFNHAVAAQQTPSTTSVQNSTTIRNHKSSSPSSSLPIAAAAAAAAAAPAESSSALVQRPQRTPTAINTEPLIGFAWDVFRASRQADANSNLVLSPLLLQITLALLQTAAVGESNAQIGRVIRHANSAQLRQLSHNVVEVAARNGAENQLGLAAAMFVDKSFGLNVSFINEAHLQGVDILSANFADASDASRSINTWAAAATKNTIPQLFTADELSGQSFLLTNAIYFRGLWQYRFSDKLEPGRFAIHAQKRKTVSFMHMEQMLRSGEFQSADGARGKWVELPYKGNDLSMIIIVPTERFALEELLQSIDGQDIARIIDKLSHSYPQLVALWLPKFSIETSYSLVESMKKLGMTELFGDSAQLPHLTRDNRPVRIDNILQRAVLRVDETGSEASVVQSLHVVTLSLSEPPPAIPIRVNQPFVALIVDRVNKVPLFLAKIHDPMVEN